MKWVCPDSTSASKLRANLTDLMHGVHKIRFSTLALIGMVPMWEVLSEGTRVWLVLWAEPEAELIPRSGI